MTLVVLAAASVPGPASATGLRLCAKGRQVQQLLPREARVHVQHRKLASGHLDRSASGTEQLCRGALTPPYPRPCTPAENPNNLPQTTLQLSKTLGETAAGKTHRRARSTCWRCRRFSSQGLDRRLCRQPNCPMRLCDLIRSSRTKEMKSGRSDRVASSLWFRLEQLEQQLGRRVAQRNQRDGMQVDKATAVEQNNSALMTHIVDPGTVLQSPAASRRGGTGRAAGELFYRWQCTRA